jgi:hypothetical protein
MVILDSHLRDISGIELVKTMQEKSQIEQLELLQLYF